MSEEAAVLEAPVVENAPETPIIEPQTPEAIPTDGQPAPAEAPTDIQIYQDVVEKYNSDNSYEMSDKEAEIYSDIEGRINSGDIKDPGLKPKEEVKPEGEKPEQEKAEETKPETEEPKKTDDSVFDSTNEAMKLVGAHDVNELPSKIKGLLDMQSSSGGKLGSENKALKESIDQMQTKQENHVKWIEDLQAGKPEAIAYLDKIRGNTPQSKPSTEVKSTGEFNPDDFVDENLANYVKNQDARLAKQDEQIAQLLGKDKEREDRSLTQKATTSWIDNVVELATSEEGKALGLTPAEARGLADKYWNDKSQPIHPKFQKYHELIVYAHKNGFPNLKAAHIVLQHESGAYARKVVDAVKEGQQSATHTPSPNSVLSDKQGRQGPNIPDPTITDDVMTQIEQGAFDKIPDAWTNAEGNLLPSKIPSRFHDRLGIAGKIK